MWGATWMTNYNIDKLVGQKFLSLIPEAEHAHVLEHIATLNAGHPSQTYTHRVMVEGRGEIWQEWTDYAILNADGEVAEYQSVGRDITAQKRAEEALRQLNETLELRVENRTREIQEMQAQFYRHEKLASLGLLASGVAHEINNPVSFIASNFASLEESTQSFLRLLTLYRGVFDSMTDHPDWSGHARRIREAEQERALEFVRNDLTHLFSETRAGIQRIVSIIESMRGLAHSDLTGAPTPFDLNRGVEDTLTITRDTYKEVCAIETDLRPLPHVCCDAGQINQVLLNLLVNAVQVLKAHTWPAGEKGQIRIRTWTEAARVCCTVEDNGPGVAPNAAPHLFDPFFTTKPPGEGTGLGLSISYDIVVNKHGGTLTCAPGEMGGACFTMSLPLDTAPSCDETEEDVK